MPLTIWKYPCPPRHHFKIEIPSGATILDFAVQGTEQMMLWALVDPDASREERQFLITGTGHEIDEDQNNLSYVGTCHLTTMSLVFHLFERLT